MTHKEARDIFFRAKWVLVDLGYSMTVGGLAEDLELAVMAMDSAARKEYAEIILPSVRAGRAKLVLRDPIEARALAFFKQVLLSIEDPV